MTRKCQFGEKAANPIETWGCRRDLVRGQFAVGFSNGFCAICVMGLTLLRTT
jgi:hypothetical protein